MGGWRDERNAEALARLRRALPPVFPGCVLAHADAQRHAPPLPRRAVESYWTAHPVRADRLARALCAGTGAPQGWTWRIAPDGRDGLPVSFRTPPAPFREAAFARGPGSCCICGQPVFRFGWHRDLWSDGTPNRRAGWHGCCVAAWKFWVAPTIHDKAIGRLQSRRCAATGKRLLRDAEVDHRVPLSTVWRDRRDDAWPKLLGFWGIPNLQALNKAAHSAKSAAETEARGAHRRAASMVRSAVAVAA